MHRLPGHVPAGIAKIYFCCLTPQAHNGVQSQQTGRWMPAGFQKVAFALRKATFQHVKDHVLARKRRPFATH